MRDVVASVRSRLGDVDTLRCFQHYLQTLQRLLTKADESGSVDDVLAAHIGRLLELELPTDLREDLEALYAMRPSRHSPPKDTDRPVRSRQLQALSTAETTEVVRRAA